MRVLTELKPIGTHNFGNVGSVFVCGLCVQEGALSFGAYGDDKNPSFRTSGLHRGACVDSTAEHVYVCESVRW